MVKLTAPGGDLWVAPYHVIVILPRDEGAEYTSFLVTGGIIYQVRETPEEILQIMDIAHA